MNFNDIFKTSFIEKVTAVSVTDIIITFCIAFCIGLFIFFIYKKTFSNIMYSANFGVALIALTLISTFVIMAVTSNVVLSLGMVGALSIVRFRTAIKEPLDIVFLFWSIAAGIVLAAQMIALAVIGSAVIGIVLLIFTNTKKQFYPYVVVLHCKNQDAEKKAINLIKKSSKKIVVKSKTVQNDNIEVNVEIRLKEDNTEFINEVSALEGINSAVLVSYNGDYLG